MVHFNRRRIRARKLARPLKPQAPLPPLEVDSRNGASTEFNVQAVGASAPASSLPRAHESTVELESLTRKADPNEETAEAFSVEQPIPPGKMEFSCPCGARLVATSEIYDKHTRCAMCQTVMLVNLVYDAESKTHEIVPFRVNPDKPL